MLEGEVRWYGKILDTQFTQLRIVPISDLHFGNPLCSLKHFQFTLDFVSKYDDVFTYLNGDLLEAVIVDSKGDIFGQKYTPQKQRDDVIELLKPIKHKILGMVTGNHEARIYRKVGMDVSRDIAKALEIPYRPDGMVLKVAFGKGNSGHPEKPYVFWGYTCFDDETEILTKYGWKKREQLIINEPVLTMKLETGELEYQPIEDIAQYYVVEHPMNNFVSRSIDACVDDDHSMVYRFDTGIIWHKTSARNIKNMTSHDIIMPQAGKYNAPGINYTDDELKLFAWVITEGHFKKDSAIIEIRQNCNSPHTKEIKTILDNIGIKYTTAIEYSKGKSFYDKRVDKTYIYNDDHIKFRILAESAKPIRRILESGKEIPGIFQDMDSRQAEIFIEELIKGDGHISHSKNRVQRMYATKNYNLASQLQELAIKHNHRATIGKHGTGYAVYISEYNKANINPKNIKVINYTGYKWCVCVKNHTVIVRRNGKVIITGNTHGYGGARTKSAKAVKVERAAAWMPSADFVTMSHDHVVNVSPDIDLIPDNRGMESDYGFLSGKVTAHRKELIKTNAYLKWGNYAEAAGYPPSDLATPVICLLTPESDLWNTIPGERKKAVRVIA